MADFTPSRGRICAAHGLVAGPDGRCVICQREGGDAEGSVGSSAVAAALLLLVMGVTGAFIYKNQRGQPAPAAVAAVAPPVAAPSVAADEEAARPDPVRQITDRRAAEEARGRAIDAAMYSVPIRMFTTPSCPHCAGAREWLTRKRLRFVELDVEGNPENQRAQKRLNPRGSVPTIDVDGDVVVGFAAPDLEGAIRRAAERRVR
jgi:glutaredoxin